MGGPVLPCAISSTSECCAELGRERPSNGEPAFPRALNLVRSQCLRNLLWNFRMRQAKKLNPVLS
jgi:hypothetical protein